MVSFGLVSGLQRLTGREISWTCITLHLFWTRIQGW